MIEYQKKISDNRKIDPWDTKQEITEVRISVHCCRYWMLSEWECADLSFPFWRLYHSLTGNSFVKYMNQQYELSPDKIVLVAPNTSFSSHIHLSPQYLEERIVGKIIHHLSEVDLLQSQGLSDQLFIHFNLGFPYDKTHSGIFEIELNDYWKSQIKQIKIDRLVNPDSISAFSSMMINSLVFYALQGLRVESWEFPVFDSRILKVLSYIDSNIEKELTNEQLSRMVNLARNSFARLFRNALKCSVKKYIQQRRIEHSIRMLHHSNAAIEDVSIACGFYDRHHFSKVFKAQTGYSPAKYRQKLGIL